MHHEIAVARRILWRGERDAERLRQRRARRRHVDERHLCAGHAPAQPRDQRTDHAGADHRDAIRRTGRRIPHRVECRLHVGSQHCARGRHTARNRKGSIMTMRAIKRVLRTTIFGGAVALLPAAASAAANGGETQLRHAIW